MQRRTILIITGLITLTLVSLAWHSYFRSEKPSVPTPHHPSITLTIRVEEESHKGRVATKSDSGTHAFCAYGFDASHAGGKNHSYQIGVARTAESTSFQITQLEGFSILRKNAIITLDGSGQWQHEEEGVAVEMSLSETSLSDGMLE